jgi:NAD-dependent dihydropyrimidine dehydrogenase PreA subunit
MLIVRKRIPSVDVDRCTGCGNCVSFCPHDCLDIVDGTCALVRPRDCRGEAFCVSACVEDAIRMTSVRGKFRRAAAAIG